VKRFSVLLPLLLCLLFALAVVAPAAAEPANPVPPGEPSNVSPGAGYSPLPVAGFVPAVPAMPNGLHILLVQQYWPWGSTATATVLNALGFTYDIVDMSEIGLVSLVGYPMIIIADDQPQAFYNAYTSQVTILRNYVNNGGVLVFFAASEGWNGGVLNTALPGGATVQLNHFEEYNYIANSAHPIVTGQLSNGVPLTNADLYSNYCSHGYFSTLPGGSSVILKDQHNHATFIEYPIGAGRVLASLNTWEHGYANGRAFALKALDDVFLYAAGGNSGWTSVNIGNALNGATSQVGSTVTINETGGDIWGTADGLRYVYKSASGNLEFGAKLTAWNSGGVASAKGGLMIRASTNAGAPEFTLHVTGTGRALKLKWRTSQGWSTANFSGPTSTNLPLWLKLSKSGTMVTAFYSSNGVNWTQLGTPQTLDGIGSNFLYGMAVASNSNVVAASATFELGGGNGPQITSFSPASGNAGTLVNIYGTNLGGATVTRFNGLSASFNQISATQIQAYVPNGVSTGRITVVTPNGTAISPTDFVVNESPLSSIMISAVSSGTVGGVAFTGSDILRYTRNTNTWQMYFDGSDLGLSANLSSFSFVPGGGILMSFAASTAVPGLGTVAPHDVVLFTPTQIGDFTAGSFQWYFDGSDVGLTTTAEKIDALSFFQTAAGSRRLRISTVGNASVIDEDGHNLTVQDEDILLFVIATTGANTTGRWAHNIHFDGTAVPGLGVEDIAGYAHDGVSDGKYLLLLDAFNVGGVVGDNKSILKLTPSNAPGGYTPSLVPWLAAGAGFPGKLDGVELYIP